MKYAGTVCGIVVFVLCFALMAYAEENKTVEQVKIFSDFKPSRLEADINTWLTENKERISITRVTQSGDLNGSGRITITIFYTLK